VAGEELEVVRLRKDFYRDGFYKVFIALVMMGAAIFLLLTISLSLHLEKPDPRTFRTDAGWRVFPPVPLNRPYVSTADLLQWISVAVPASFSFDFLNYASSYNNLPGYYTPDGWKKLTDLLIIYANSKTIQEAKLFIQATPSAAPTVFSQGLINTGELAGRYGWWVQMPINIRYSNADKTYTTPVVVKVLVVRTSTLDDLTGIAIQDVLISKVQGGKAHNNV
jgi:intracellular multiplication protein IcmL